MLRAALPAALPALALALALAPDASRAGFSMASTCPATSPPTYWSGDALDTTTKSGTTFQDGRLLLARQGSLFKATQLASPGTIMYAAVADFNRDGWPDFAGASENTANDYLTIFRNYTWQNENCTSEACTSYTGGGAPNWDDPNVVIVPKFIAGTNLHTAYVAGAPVLAYNGRYSLAGADFNGDGWPDLFEGYAASSASHAIGTLNLYLNAASNDAAGNARWQARYAAQANFTPSTVFGRQLWSTGNTQAADYNRDGRMDVLIGNGAAGGSIRILLNNCPGTMQANGVVLCSQPPKFTDGGYLISALDMVGTNAQGYGTNVGGGTPTFAYADVDADSYPDLVIGAPNCCTTATRRLRLFKGCAGGAGCTAGLETTASQSLSFLGGATNVFVADFSLDGKPDVIVATDNFNYNPNNGAATYYYVNNGTSTPFSAAPSQLTFHTATSQDYDIGFVFDYDQDPQKTPDLMIADGNNANSYYVLADRVSPQYVECGDAYSGTIKLGALENVEMAITAGRMKPTATTNGGTLTYYMSNEEPPSWVQATLCPGSTTDYCATFPRATGRSVRWKATMCSNSARTKTPVISAVEATFDYTRTREHYRSGVVVGDGVAYVGAFHQPGDRGRFYGLNADLVTACNGRDSAVCWEGGAKLDALADTNRKIYTALANVPVRVDFTTSNAGDALLRNLLGTADAASTANLITWVRSSRFGLGTQTVPLTKLGAIETSTPALLTRPSRPNWYSFVSAIERSRIDAFIAAQASRKPLVLFGAKDGMIHALHTRPSDITSSKNGQEAWAYIPPTVAAGMLKDYTSTITANAAAANGLNYPTMASYPDGSPTLVDYYAGGGVYKTVAIVAEGNGGKSLTALDVTQTVDPNSELVTGPVPMWSASPGGGEAGKALSKPVVARVLLGERERYLAIAATGVDGADATGQKGRIVSAYDLATGQLMWKFQAKCPVTSDLSVFETDDTLEPGGPTLNGFSDRVVFADQCGYVYKLAPAADRAGGWYENTGMGAYVASTTPDGKKQYALFSTKLTTGALGADRPIGGTMAARTDSSTRMILFFGTGGLETQSATAKNAFYAVYADTGQIRSKVLGTCNASGSCEKFYGGTVVTAEQVIYTRTIDPAVGTGTCDMGSTQVQALRLSADSSNNFVTDFTLAVSSAVMGSLYGDAGALFFATLSGDVARIGAPRAPTAGGDTRSGTGQGMGVGDTASSGEKIGTYEPFIMMGWRVVL